MKKFTILLMVIPFLFLINFSILAEDVHIGKQAPNFTLTDSNGNTHSLSDYKGKIVVLEWTNYGCPFVGKHYKSGSMQMLQKKYTEEGIIWLSICSSAPGKQGNFSSNEINEKAEEFGTSYTAYLKDEDGKVGHLYGAKTTPHMFIINAEGKLVYAGGIDNKKSTNVDDIKGAENYVAEALDLLLQNKEIEKNITSPYGCSVKYK